MYPHHSRSEVGGTGMVGEMLDGSGWEVFTQLLGAEDQGPGTVVMEETETTILTSEEKTRLEGFAAGSRDAELRREMEALMSVNRLALDYFAKLLRREDDGDGDGDEEGDGEEE